MFLEEVLFAMADVHDQDFIEPDTVLLAEDEVVGEIPRELRQLYTLMLRAQAGQGLRQELYKSRLGLVMSGPGRARYAMNLEAETIRNIFFLSLYGFVCPDRRWPLDELQIRRGWKAVRVPIHC